MGEQYILGLDIGGTAVKAGMVNPRGEINHFQSIPTNGQQGPDHVLSTIIDLVRAFQEREILAGIGIAIAGAVDSKTGVCKYSPNLNWKNVPIGQIIRESTGLETKLINDANAACLGEYFFGAGRNFSSILCLTIGTGIGSGIILDNKLFVGNSGLAPEAGHMAVLKGGPRCSCGRKGCWETLASASAIIKRAAERINAGTNTVLNDLKDSLSLEDVLKAWQQGDNLAVEVITEAKEYLAMGIANLVNLFNPQCVVLGGGLIDLNGEFCAGLEDMVKELVFPSFQDTVLIKKAQLGNKAGLAGGAGLFWNNIETLGDR